MKDNIEYDRLIVPEHRHTKFLAWLNANLGVVRDIAVCAESFDRAFDLDLAVGVQLDVVGRIVGRSRLLNFEPSDGSGALLGDDIYRLLIRAKISINQWDGTTPGLVSLWEALFPQYRIIVQDNQDMTMKIYIVGPTLPLEQELLAYGYLAPKPEGVFVNYEFVTIDEADMPVCIGTAAEEETVYEAFDVVSPAERGTARTYVAVAAEMQTIYEIY